MRSVVTARMQHMQRTFNAFTAGQKAVTVIGGIALVFAAMLVYRWAATPAYAPLYTNIAPADASAVVDQLASSGTPYELTNGGATILVPQSEVYAARIQLSGEGLPGQSSGGYSLLDNQSLSTSQFQEQTSYKRAMEGELEKTIEALDQVDTALVHVAMPQEKLFSSDQSPTTASVLVATRPGSTLGTPQVQAIVNLVASSIEGLDPKRVTVTDSAGNLLSVAGEGVDSVAGSRTQQVNAFEAQMTRSVVSVLDRVLGPGNSAVQVTADLNFDETTTHTTRYFTDPNVVPLSDSTTTEKYTGAQGSGSGAGGAVGPAGQFGQASGSGATKYQKKQRTSDNAVSQTVEQRNAAPGNIESLHVGIVLDRNALHGGTSPAIVQSLVASALGIDPKRGDTVQVSALPFDRTQEKADAAALVAAKAADQRAQLIALGKTLGLSLVVGTVLFIAWRRGRKRQQLRDKATTYVVEQLRRGPDPMPAIGATPTPELGGPHGSELRVAARDEISALVERQPEEVAQLLRGWLVDTER